MKHTPRRAARALAILVVAAQHPDTIGAAEAGGAAGMSEGDAIALCADMRQAGLLRRGRGLRLMHHPSKITLEDVVLESNVFYRGPNTNTEFILMGRRMTSRSNTRADGGTPNINQYSNSYQLLPAEWVGPFYYQ